MELLLRAHTQIIGGGGYGVVRTGTEPPHDREAVKFLYKGECPSAKKEYILNKRVYGAYKVFRMCSGNTAPIAVVKPLNFIENGGGEYSCALVMQRLIFDRDYAIHPALNGVVPLNQLNKLALTSRGQPRGYYLDPTETSKYLPLAQVTYCIGLLDAIAIFGAKLIPVDAEYVITKERKIAMLDFGMFKDLTVSQDNIQEVAEEISRAQEYNLYYHPYSELVGDECKRTFLLGFTEGYLCFNNGNEIYTSLYESLLTLYNEEV
jgi:hypothetical protein